MSHGLYIPKAPPPSLIEKLQAWSLVLPPTAAFTHLTSAELHGWWLPEAPPHPVFAAIRKADPRPRRSGLYVCRHPKPFPMTITSDGIKITTPAETLLACARDLGILDVVILADSALRERCNSHTTEDHCGSAPKGRADASSGHPATRSAQ